MTVIAKIRKFTTFGTVHNLSHTSTIRLVHTNLPSYEVLRLLVELNPILIKKYQPHCTRTSLKIYDGFDLCPVPAT